MEMAVDEPLHCTIFNNIVKNVAALRRHAIGARPNLPHIMIANAMAQHHGLSPALDGQ